MIVNTPSIFKIKRLVKIIKISNIFSFLFVACCLTLAARCSGLETRSGYIGPASQKIPGSSSGTLEAGPCDHR
jgi:hypothetical protein